MPQVRGDIRKARAALLRDAGKQALHRYFADRIGGKVRVLVERADAASAFGHSDHFAPVRLEGGIAAGTVVDARVSGHSEEHLLAQAA
jgi:threonylcarbamoyladenosine tRNA methylthiotransferase MtaB